MCAVFTGDMYDVRRYHEPVAHEVILLEVASYKAARAGHWHVVCWLLMNTLLREDELSHTEALTLAADTRHFGMLNWLKHCTLLATYEKAWAELMYRAMELQDQADIINWILTNVKISKQEDWENREEESNRDGEKTTQAVEKTNTRSDDTKNHNCEDCTLTTLTTAQAAKND